MRPFGGGDDSTRRRFVNFFLGGSATALLGSIFFPVIRFMSPPQLAESTTNEVEAGPINDPDFLEKGFKIIRFGAEPVIVLKVADSDYRAFSATCTHLECIVTYQQDKTRIFCNCHNGVYDLNGRNIAGPPPRPLTLFKVNLVAQSGKQPTVVVSRA